MSALEPDDPRSVGEHRLPSRPGVGGTGRIFLGRSPGGRLVAVEMVHGELLRRPELRDRFRREAEAAGRVGGAFAAPVVDADPDAPLPWPVTGYIAGPSLDQAVAERGPFEPGRLWRSRPGWPRHRCPGSHPRPDQDVGDPGVTPGA